MQTTTERIIIEIPANPVFAERDIRSRILRMAAYCRVSTDSEDQLNSYKSQIDYYTTIISENPNWKLAGIFADEGLSGLSTKKREQFNRMIQKCRRGQIDMIIVKSVSRFARNTLDSLGCVRKLKAMGVGVIFEKEGVNTMETDDETLLTIFAALAQAESQSLSKNVRRGYQQAYKLGKVPFHVIYGYRKGPEGQPEIIPEQAAIVRRIYHRYLTGQSVGQIRKDLEADGILTHRGNSEWAENNIQQLLRNERYAGDVLLQKTYVKDLLTNLVVKNNGELPQYYIQNNHPAIIERDIWNKTQEEIARRCSKRKTPSPTARTGISKYSGKYALNEILVCGQCGSSYRRTTWAKPQGRIGVWRCISQLEHGKRKCGNSPTIPEKALHAAIMGAISETILRKPLLDAVTESVKAAACANTGVAEYQAARHKMAALKKQADKIITDSVRARGDEDFYDEQYRKVMEEHARYQKTVQEFEARDSLDRYTGRQVTDAVTMLANEPLLLSEYNDQAVRQLVDTIRVLAKDRIMVTLKGGVEIEQNINI